MSKIRDELSIKLNFDIDRLLESCSQIGLSSGNVTIQERDKIIALLSLYQYVEVRLANASPSDLLRSVMAEVERASSLFPEWPTDPLHAFAILNEEAGELDRAIVQRCYKEHKSKEGDVEEEAVQVAAMALRFIMSLKHYEYKPAAQHDQSEPPRIPCAACDRGDYSWGHSEECEKAMAQKSA